MGMWLCWVIRMVSKLVFSIGPSAKDLTKGLTKDLTKGLVKTGGRGDRGQDL